MSLSEESRTVYRKIQGIQGQMNECGNDVSCSYSGFDQETKVLLICWYLMHCLGIVSLSSFVCNCVTFDVFSVTVPALSQAIVSPI